MTVVLAPNNLDKSSVIDDDIIFSAQNLSKKYGSLKVLSNVSFNIRRGEVVAVLGENGAGKSTLSSLIAGLIKPTTGSMQWQKQNYSPRNPNDALSQGIGLIHQEMKLIPDLSIAENIFLGNLPMKNGAVDRKKMVELATIQLKRLGLNIPANTLVKSLRIAAQQQVEIAKALVRDAKFLLLDEPTAALGSEETQLLFQQVRKLKSEGVSFIYVSHRMEEIAQIADRIIVMRDGEAVQFFDRADIPIREVVEAMVGRPLERMFPSLPKSDHKPLLELQSLTSARDDYRDISITIHAGEIFGIAGIVGAGRTELVRAIAGADPIKSGKIFLNGAQIAIHHPADALNAGIVLIPEDRKGQGLLLEQNIADNIVLGNYQRATKYGWATKKNIRAFANQAIQRFGIKGKAPQKVYELSGGNQQKIVIARAISMNPCVVIMDEPTRGIDVGARATIYDDIAQLAAQGIAVIMVSSDLDEVLGMSHRLMVMARGKNQGILQGSDINRFNVMKLATA